MSDNTQPASSRRALREKRRAEMEALLASSKAEQEAREQAARGQQAPADSSKDQTAAKQQPAVKEQAPAKGQPAAKDQAPAKGQSAAPKKAAPAKKTEPAATAARDSKPATAAKPKADTPGKGSPKPTTPPRSDSAPAQEAKAKDTPTADTADAADLGERASLRRARDREALRERRRLQEEVSQLTTNVPTVEAAEEPKPLTRRQLRLQALAEQKNEPGTSSGKPATPPAKPKGRNGDDSPETTVMSVEEALAARREHAPEPAVDPNLLHDDDHEIDLEVLAHQREMAARAAIISRRAAERERLRQENVKAGKEANSPDPFTGAMGNIRDFEDQVARSGVSGPQTSSVSLNLDTTGKIAGPKQGSAAKKPAPKPAAKPSAKPAPKPVSTASPTKAGSTAKAQPAKSSNEAPKPQPQGESSEVVDLPRVEAVEAQGLQPLDALTAGVRRANNMFIAMIAALAIGGIALVAGLIMMLGN